MVPFELHAPYVPKGDQPTAIAAGAAGVGVGSAINKLNDPLAMVAVVRGLREALGMPAGAIVVG